MDEGLTVSAVWREALAIIRRYPFATIFPALVLTALADAPYYVLEDSGFGWEQVLTFMTAAFAFCRKRPSLLISISFPDSLPALYLYKGLPRQVIRSANGSLVLVAEPFGTPFP